MDTGVVVEIKESEFVWIPVDDVIFDKSREEDLPKSNENTVKNTYTPMCIMVNGNYRGMFYNQLGNKITLEYPNNENYQGKENEYIEPDIVPTDTEKNSSYGISSDGLQREYNKMIESVSKYKGFYVARYEAGIDKEGNIVFKDANITENEVTTVNADNEKTSKWYGLYSTMKRFTGDNDNIVSSMIWGSQYDAMMNWMVKNGIDVSSVNKEKKEYNNNYWWE